MDRSVSVLVCRYQASEQIWGWTNTTTIQVKVITALLMSLSKAFSSFHHSYIVYHRDRDHVRCCQQKWHVLFYWMWKEFSPHKYITLPLTLCCICVHNSLYMLKGCYCTVCVCMCICISWVNVVFCSVYSVIVEKNNPSVGGDNIFCISALLWYNLSLWCLLWI